MKRLATITATALTTLALAGCTAPTFQAAPETMPAVEPGSVPAEQAEVTSWDTAEIEFSGPTDELEELARDSAQTIRDYSAENPDSSVAQLSLVKSTAKNAQNVQLTISNELSSAQLKQAAKETACALVAGMPSEKSSGAPWLSFMTLFSTETGEKFMYSDTQLCE